MDVDTLRRRLLSGEQVDLRVGDPATSQHWTAERSVSAELLAEVLTEPVDRASTPRRVWLVGARISGVIDLQAAVLERGLRLHQCVVDEPILLPGADVPFLRFTATHLRGIAASWMRCRDMFHVCDGSVCTGEIQLVGAQLGQFALSGGTFRGPDGRVLNAEGLTVAGNVFCTDGFVAEGEFRLRGGHIGGQLNCSGGTFCNASGYALNADGLGVTGDVFFGNGFAADGQVRLLGAQIGGQFNCSGGTFRNPGEYALAADRLRVGDEVFCGDGFTAEGAVRLPGAQIGGNLACSGGTFRSPNETALDLHQAVIGDAVVLRPHTFEGRLDLTHAQVGRWRDDVDTWPQEVRLQGFSYDVIESAQATGVRERLQWLRRDPDGYQPQLYEQLAAAYRRSGDDAAARQVLIAKQWQRRAALPQRWRRWPTMAWSALLRATIGYGYRPWLILWPAVTLFILGWLLFRRDRQHGLIVAATGPDTPTFSSARYTLDLLLPVANLGERDVFTPIGEAAWHSLAFTLSGWLLALILVAGLTGIFKHE